MAAAAPAMARALLLCLVAASLALSSSAQSCTTLTFSRSGDFALCSSLQRLSSTLHWTYHPSNGTVDIAFRAPQSNTGWVAWGINPQALRMTGTQALVAFVNGSTGRVAPYTTSVTVAPLQPSSITIPATNLQGDFSGGFYTIYATLQLTNNETRVNQVWQSSTAFSGGFPAGHATTGENVQSLGTLDFLSGESTAATNNIIRRRNRHGVLNAVSWGVLMPMGAIIARYLRVFKSADPAWFYLHVGCQCSAYIVGVAGWGTGLKLGSDSVDIKHNLHRNIGITLFCLATLQVFALLLRPNKDHKYRIFWNVYHWSVGYAVIILSIVNIFEGFDILEPAKKWKRIYVGILIALGAVALVLEVFTWGVVLRRRSRGGEKSHHGAANGAANGYGDRQAV
ncbi:hypothetical protein Taro_001943 [Colocasia esculenta]|uniref:Cytochrome b561 and DOMON domain-containing protein n=1 Tax=Colocasia esculenta TaxID=4460 RepID=A0A843TBE0_COLES|nr:hypothetical protein [Colocasia esculenta]